MKIPVITGIIRRRILLNYRVQPEVLATILPGNFRPKLVKGQAIAGICLIRLEQIRPKGLPAMIGISSENSAHRIAVEWEADGATHEGPDVNLGQFFTDTDDHAADDGTRHGSEAAQDQYR